MFGVMAIKNEVKVIISSKATAEVYLPDKIIRIFGELGLNGFLASTKNMKWLKPTHLRNKELTYSEQQEVIRVVNEFYKGKKERIYFKDDSIMNRLLLKKELLKIKIPTDSYCLTGKCQNQSFCLLHNKSRWEVFYNENGKKIDLEVFVDEGSACKYLFLTLKNKFIY